MALRDTFAGEDWARIVGSPMLAGIAVTAADPGGLWSVIRESTATAGALRTARAEGQTSELVREIAAAYETPEGRDIARGALKAQAGGRKKPAEVVEAALAELGAVSALVASKAPGEAAAYRAWLQDIARQVAEAGTEGGFLGFGGEKVSAAEKATLERLAAALA